MEAGVPEVERADTHRLYRAVDDNGWTTSITNWRGYTTNYDYDTVGRLTGIDLPSPWSDTAISYTYTGGALLQTVTRDTERTTSTYDAMLRPVQVLKETLSGGGSSVYLETDYDALGREVFKSLPSEHTAVMRPALRLPTMPSGASSPSAKPRAAAARPAMSTWRGTRPAPPIHWVT